MKKMLKRTAALLAAAALSLGAYLGALQLTGNFHEVVAHEFYRSNQPSPTEIVAYARNYGIKTIINLRGRNEHAPWYDQETAKSGELGLTHVDFAMSASHELAVADISRLSNLMRDLPKPILIHCQSGADRTGLASAIYLNQIAGADAATSEKQLSIRYGHFGIPYLSAAYPMDESWEKFQAAIALAAGR